MDRSAVPLHRRIDCIANEWHTIGQGVSRVWFPVDILQLDPHVPIRTRLKVHLQLASRKGDGLCQELATLVICMNGNETVRPNRKPS